MSQYELMGVMLFLALTTAAAPPVRDSQEAIDRRVQAALAKVASNRTERTVTDLRADAEQTPCYAKFELAFKVNTAWRSPYDPDDVRVDGEIRAPDGRIFTVPAFYCLECRPVDGKTRVALWPKFVTVGQPGWRLRYAPTKPGRHRVTIRVRDRQGVFASSPVEFTAAGPNTAHLRWPGIPRPPRVSGFITGGYWRGHTGASPPAPRRRGAPGRIVRGSFQSPIHRRGVGGELLGGLSSVAASHRSTDAGSVGNSWTACPL